MLRFVTLSLLAIGMMHLPTAAQALTCPPGVPKYFDGPRDLTGRCYPEALECPAGWQFKKSLGGTLYCQHPTKNIGKTIQQMRDAKTRVEREKQQQQQYQQQQIQQHQQMRGTQRRNAPIVVKTLLQSNTVPIAWLDDVQRSETHRLNLLNRRLTPAEQASLQTTSYQTASRNVKRVFVSHGMLALINTLKTSFNAQQANQVYQQISQRRLGYIDQHRMSSTHRAALQRLLRNRVKRTLRRGQ